MRRRFWVVLVLPLLGACSAYYSGYEFEPRPLEVAHALPGVEDRAASVLVTVVGIHKRDAERGIPASVELRIRIDSNTDQEIRLTPADVQLFAANLAAFPEPIAPEGALVVPPHGTGTLNVYFPFPDDKVPGNYDLEGLSARWTLTMGGRPSTGNATFTRDSRDPEYYPFGFGFGWGISSYNYYPHYGHCHGHGGSSGGRPVPRH